MAPGIHHRVRGQPVEQQEGGGVSERWAPRFFAIWAGQACSLVGSALVQFALVWWLTRETGSATVLATASLVGLLPQILLGPFAGTVVDRWSRRLVMIVADTAIAAATAVLLVLFATGTVQVWQVYAALMARSLGGAFHFPAMAASTALLVPERHLTRIAGLNQLMQGLLTILSPPLGALLLETLPTQGVLAIDLVTAALGVLPLLVFSIPRPPRQATPGDGGQPPPSYWRDLREGFAYVAAWRGLLGVLLLAMLLNFLLSPSSTLLPLLVVKEFGGGAMELGWVESMFGVGFVLGGLILSAWGGFKRRILTALVGILGIGIGVVMCGLAPGDRLGLLLVSTLVVGLAQVFANGPIGAILQATVRPDHQGRVFSLVGAGATAMVPLSLLIAGPVADRVGVRAWYVAGGAICIVVALAAMRIPVIMNIEAHREGGEADGQGHGE